MAARSDQNLSGSCLLAFFKRETLGLHCVMGQIFSEVHFSININTLAKDTGAWQFSVQIMKAMEIIHVT